MKTAVAVLGLGVTASGAALAGPADYVFLPAVAYAEREFDLKYRAAAMSGEPSAQAVTGSGSPHSAGSTSVAAKPSSTTRPSCSG